MSKARRTQITTYGPSMPPAEILAVADAAVDAIRAARGIGVPLDAEPAPPVAVKTPRGPKVPRWLQKLNEAPHVPTPGAEPGAFIGPDGRVCLGVWLDGARGGGTRIVVNEAEWARVALAHGDRWTLKEVRPGHSYVVGLGRAAGVTLARALCRATAGEAVVYRNGDSLDLSKGNLETLPAGRAVTRALREMKGGKGRQEGVAALRDIG